MTTRKRCPNKDAHRDQRWGMVPDMVRLYIRTSERITEVDGKAVPHWDQKIKRRWVPVGWMCSECREIVLDEEEGTDGS